MVMTSLLPSWIVTVTGYCSKRAEIYEDSGYSGAVDDNGNSYIAGFLILVQPLALLH